MFYLFDAGLILLVALGCVLFGWASAPAHLRPLEAMIWPGLALLGAWALGLWLVGSLGFYWPFVAGALFGPFVVAVVVWKRARVAARWRELRAGWPALRAEVSGFDALLGLFLLAASISTLLLTLAPPSAADYDSLVYHLAVPRQYERAGAIVELPYDHHSYFPFGMEMLFGIGLGVSGPVFAKLFHWLMLPTCALILVALGRLSGGARSGLLAASLWISMPVVLGEATTAYVDIGFCAFVFAATWALLRFRSSGDNAFLWWSGAFCGLALNAKYFGALIFGFLGLWLLVELAVSRGLSLRRLAAFALPALLLGAPVYLRNALWTGNPVFPFAFEIFGGEGWTLEMARAYAVDQAQFGFGRSLADLVLLPWRLALTPLNLAHPVLAEFTPPAADGRSGFFDVRGLALSSLPGPAIVAFGSLALLARRKGREIGFLAWFFGFLFVFWFVTSQQIRYLLPAMGFLAVVAGAMMVSYAPRLPLSRWIGGVALSLWLLFSLRYVWEMHSFAWPVIFGQQKPEAFLRRSFSAYPVGEWIGANVPADARLAVYGEPRGFYFPRPYFWADAPHNRLIPTESLQNGDDLADRLLELGATHIVWNSVPGENGGVFSPPQPFFDQMVATERAVLLEERRGYRVYELRRSVPAD